MRFLHSMIRVYDLDAALHFFCELLGLREVRRRDHEKGRFTLVFLGTGAAGDDAQVELTHNWDQQEPYELGSGYGHIAIGVPDIHGACARLQGEGVNIPRPPGPMKHGTTVLAFVEDPDGYKIELIERA